MKRDGRDGCDGSMRQGNALKFKGYYGRDGVIGARVREARYFVRTMCVARMRKTCVACVACVTSYINQKVRVLLCVAYSVAYVE